MKSFIKNNEKLNFNLDTWNFKIKNNFLELCYVWSIFLKNKLLFFQRRDGRVAEGVGLLNRYMVEKLYRGFESPSLRHKKKTPQWESFFLTKRGDENTRRGSSNNAETINNRFACKASNPQTKFNFLNPKVEDCNSPARRVIPTFFKKKISWFRFLLLNFLKKFF